MSDDDEASEAGSDACSASSKRKTKCKECSHSRSADSSETGSSSDQDASDSLSGSEECLARTVCLKRTQPRCLYSSGSSDQEQSSTCSASSASESAKNAHSESKDHVPEPPSGSQNTESTNATEGANATESSTAAAPSEDSSQSNKTTSNCDKKTCTKMNDKSAWSLSEDSLLRSMKEANDGLSWDEIGKSLNRGKNECKSRWKAIKVQPKQENLPKDKPNGNAEHKTRSPTDADGTTAAGDAEPNTPNQPVTAAAAAAAAADNVSHQPGDDDDNDDNLSEHERQQRYWHRHIGRHLYPASMRVEPDAHFSQSDCRVLEMVDARYAGMRWLEVQARFYNETGRMVPLDVLRRKCETATARTEADIDGWLESIPD